MNKLRPLPTRAASPFTGKIHQDSTAARASSQAFVQGQVESGAGPIPHIGTTLTLQDRQGSLRVRLGIGRSNYRVVPGLYAVGSPIPESPVLVTANYKLSLDALRSELGGLDAWILVLDTKGVNVWCSAGKGSFGNEELERRIVASRLALVVTHRELILPQLAAPGIAAWRMKKSTGWTCSFGPVRAADIKPWLAAGRRADTSMRRVRFPLKDRLALIPLDLTAVLPAGGILLAGLIVLAVLLRLVTAAVSSVSAPFSLWSALDAGLGVWGAIAGALLVGSALVPALLPWLPFRAFSLKGALMGLIYVAILLVTTSTGPVQGISFLLGLPMVSAHAALGFTGSTTYTSLTGVEKEVRALRFAGPILMGIAAIMEITVLAGWLA